MDDWEDLLEISRGGATITATAIATTAILRDQLKTAALVESSFCAVTNEARDQRRAFVVGALLAHVPSVVKDELLGLIRSGLEGDTVPGDSGDPGTVVVR